MKMDCIYISTIVNGETSASYNSKLSQNKKDSIETSVNNLKQNIILCNNEEKVLLKKHRIIVIGDSNIRGYRCNLNSLLSNNYKLYSVAKPGSNSNELHQTAKEEISQLSNNDAIVVCSGTNDYELNELSRTWCNISIFITEEPSY